MSLSVKTPDMVRVSLEDVVQQLSNKDPNPMSRDAIRLGVVVGDDLHAVLAARIVSRGLTPVHVYLPKAFHAFLEMDAWAPSLREIGELVQLKKASKFLRLRNETIVQPLVSQGINTAVLLGDGSGMWTIPEIAEGLCRGLDQVLIVQNLEESLDSGFSSPPLQAGPQSLARATHAYRSKAPNMLKALVFLSAEAWMGQKSEIAAKLVSWLDIQQATAQRLKLGLDVSRLSFPASERLQQRQLNETVNSLITCSWADLLGYMAYADLIATDQKELIRIARLLGKDQCNLL